MRAIEGHVLELQARAGVSPDELQAARRDLIELLGVVLLECAVDGERALRLSVATASRAGAHAAVWAGVRTAGLSDLFIKDAATGKPVTLTLARAPTTGSSSQRPG